MSTETGHQLHRIGTDAGGLGGTIVLLPWREPEKTRAVDFAPDPRISIPASGHDRPRLKA